MSSSDQSCLIVGAGIAGLLAARELTARGWSVTVVDKGRVPGGRMATRSLGPARFDYGAQYFTVRDARFAETQKRWCAEGLLREWPQTGSYSSPAGMRRLTQDIASNLRVHTATRIVHVAAVASGWCAASEEGAIFEARSLLITAPAQQALDLMRLHVPAECQAMLQSVEYQPCLALLVELDRASAIPAPGCVSLKSGPAAWIADNGPKGVSSVPGALTVHASPEFSREHWDDEAAAELLLSAARPHFGNGQPRTTHFHRWRYSLVTRQAASPYLLVNNHAPLIFAGDGFGGPRVEGAAISGLAAAEHLIQHA